MPPLSRTFGSAPKATAPSVMTACPGRAWSRASAPVARRTVTVCRPSAGAEKTKLSVRAPRCRAQRNRGTTPHLPAPGDRRLPGPGRPGARPVT
ncbi:hypothetical protein GCM10010495_67890 [Kitasatospora herbaricolor]|nr:hypothetical protein GCM10010495_67890 [Kitasatospora herbaricolor]